MTKYAQFTKKLVNLANPFTISKNCSNLFRPIYLQWKEKLSVTIKPNLPAKLPKKQFHELGPGTAPCKLMHSSILKKIYTFVQLAFNLSNGVTDTLESSTVLLYLKSCTVLYTQMVGRLPYWLNGWLKVDESQK
jgi:hypothetical protein